jgi:hypothetical protein
MNRKLFLAGAILVSILFIIALMPSMEVPVLYQRTPAEFSTMYHDDPDIYEKLDLDATESSLLLMQDLLDVSGPITLSIRINDPESAMADLVKYKSLLGQTQNLIVKIQMNQTDLGKYLATHKENQQILSNFLNETSNLNQLKHLEIQFSNQESPGDFTSLVFEESAIRKRMEQLYENYRQNEPVINSTATKYGLNTTVYEESLKNFAETVREEDQNQVKIEQQAIRLKAPTTSLSLTIKPTQGHYGDSLLFLGYLRNIQVSQINPYITIVIDNGDNIGSKTDTNGRYYINYSIGKISTGHHNVYSSYSGQVSEIQYFDVLEVNSTTSLSTAVTNGSPQVTFAGQVMTGQQVPVHDAPVKLIWDDGNTKSILTDAEGLFSTEVTFPIGNHTIQAFFAGEGFPIGASYSKPVHFVVNYSASDFVSKGLSFTSIFAIVGIMSLSMAAAAFYLRRRKTQQEKIRYSPDHPEVAGYEKSVEKDLKIPEPDVTYESSPFPINFDNWVEECGLRNAAYQLYMEILVLIGKDIHTSVSHSMTPREVAFRCRDRTYSHDFLKFVGIYEKVRYGPECSADEEIVQFIDQSEEVMRLIRRGSRD